MSSQRLAAVKLVPRDCDPGVPGSLTNLNSGHHPHWTCNWCMFSSMAGSCLSPQQCRTETGFIQWGTAHSNTASQPHRSALMLLCFSLNGRYASWQAGHQTSYGTPVLRARLWPVVALETSNRNGIIPVKWITALIRLPFQGDSKQLTLSRMNTSGMSASSGCHIL